MADFCKVVITIASVFFLLHVTPEHSGNRSQQQEVKQPGMEETFKARPLGKCSVQSGQLQVFLQQKAFEAFTSGL